MLTIYYNQHYICSIASIYNTFSFKKNFVERFLFRIFFVEKFLFRIMLAHFWENI